MSATIDLPRLAVLLGIGKSAAYNAAKADQLPVPVFRIGGRIVVPVAPVAALLGITPDEVRGATDNKSAA
ncbi:MAG: DNA-binding protein [Corynebacterium provencense]|uniref:helix-turn-helix transcriptional regulator n=1 Tax=Corynebacterium provencense TaxID=1737425 RepID=UPI002989CE14|nr:DNA-binding protein [Corynebacterium provencense]